MIARPNRRAENGRLAAALVMLLVIPFLLCQCRGKTDKELVAVLIAEMAVQVEKKNAAGLVAHLAADYRDGEGRDRAATADLAEDYFRRYRFIKVKVLTSRIEMGEGGGARVQTDVSLYSGAAAALRKAVGFDGENYRFSSILRKEDEWRFVEASWEAVPVDGLFPESLAILRELFPDL
ncbi:MAG: hypothetical protein JXO51_11480 [Candidatus Aminicenantes bacterium]|nr:hypothetical protein [Candidatus Aminicenantes bacterium]